jgi:hypothetical protein
VPSRLMAVGGIGWGQAVSGLYARGHGSCDVEGKLEIVWSTPIFALLRMRHIPMPPSSISHGSWPGSSRAASARSSRVDVPPPEGFQPLASYKIANNYRKFMTNDKLVADLRKRFEGYTGPPANKGGVRLAR